LTEPKLPKIFLDRSLGTYKVVKALRDKGIDCVALDEHFGRQAGQTIQDTEWLKLVGERGWIAFTKDKNIRWLTDEKDAVIQHKVKCFCLSSGELSAQQMTDRFLTNLEKIALACQEPGPFIYNVYENKIEKLNII